jgi:hypothetical protein
MKLKVDAEHPRPPKQTMASMLDDILGPAPTTPAEQAEQVEESWRKFFAKNPTAKVCEECFGFALPDKVMCPSCLISRTPLSTPEAAEAHRAMLEHARATSTV